MDYRQKALQDWLTASCHLGRVELEPVVGDASFRRYFRVKAKGPTAIVMDAPPGREDCRPFVAIANALQKKILRAPAIIASDIARGFLLLEDFGDRLYLNELTADNADTLYTSALQSLAVMQSCHYIPDWVLPQFNAEFVYQELQVFKEWFLLRHLNLQLPADTEKMLADFFHFLANASASQPQVFMHRDYHSANLLILPEQQVGITRFSGCVHRVLSPMIWFHCCAIVILHGLNLK